MLYKRFLLIKKITSFTKIIVKVGNHKNMKIVKNRPERVKPLEIQLENFHVVPWVLLSGLKVHGPWSSQPLERLGHG